jgi:hypothetical protein
VYISVHISVYRAGHAAMCSRALTNKISRNDIIQKCALHLDMLYVCT